MMSSWTRPRCQCCQSDTVEPLVAVELMENVSLETKRWLMSRIQAEKRMGGAELMVHPGEDDDGNLLLVSASRHALLRAAEVLGLYKPYKDGSMVTFSNRDKGNFKTADNITEFLTLAERQFIVKRELENIKAVNEHHIPGYPTESLYSGEAIFNRLRRGKILHKLYPMHEEEMVDKLTTCWYTPPSLTLEPIDSIYKYFGGSVAMYIRFLEFFTCSMVPMAIFGIAMSCFAQDSVDKYILFAIFNVIWSTVSLELWKRRSSTLAYAWGSLQMKSQFEEPRVDYKGLVGINPITNRHEPYYPSWKRAVKLWFVSGPILCLFLALSLIAMLVFFKMEAWAKAFHKENEGSWSLVPYVPSTLYTLFITITNLLFKTVAKVLTEWENHRLESSFQNHLTVKVLVFRFVNCFAVLFYIAFYMQDVELLRKELASLLIVTQIINQFMETLLPYLYKKIYGDDSSSKESQLKNTPVIDKIKAQGEMTPFPGMFDDYMELFVQFGYISLFSCIYPLSATLIALNNMTEIHTDMLKLCRIFRKPFVAPAANIGVWQIAFEMLGFLSIITNCFLISISPQVVEYCTTHSLTSHRVWLWTVAVEHALIAIKVILALAIPDIPQWVRLKIDRVEYQSLQALKQKVVELDKGY
eukprot:gi/632978225/ref/XP_007905789.1/ PREDICTED: anoctamin-10-like [Callorhinchus milii]